MQFWEAALFASKAKINVFRKKFTMGATRACGVEKKISKSLILAMHTLLHHFPIFSTLCRYCQVLEARVIKWAKSVFFGVCFWKIFGVKNVTFLFSFIYILNKLPSDGQNSGTFLEQLFLVQDLYLCDFSRTMFVH